MPAASPVADRQQHHSVRRRQVPGRPRRQLGLDDVQPELGVGLANEVGVEREDLRVVPFALLELEAHESSTGSSYSTHSLRSAPVES